MGTFNGLNPFSDASVQKWSTRAVFPVPLRLERKKKK
jgi:hypothetical protein